MKEWLREKIGTTKWSVLPNWLWFLIASPLLWWAFGADPKRSIFSWPIRIDKED